MEDINNAYEIIKKRKLHKSDISVCQLKEQINKYKHHLTNNLDKYATMFNTIMSNMANTISKNFPDDGTLDIYANVINKIIASTPFEPISLFLLYVYRNDEYRHNILEGNDNFFLTNTHTHITNDDQEKINMMFQFKKCWIYMDEQMKKYTRSCMITMVNISEQYIKCKININDLDTMMKALNL